MYVSPNFPTKKALKEAVANGVNVSVFNPGLFGNVPSDGLVCCEGPHAPKPHRWYAEVTIKDDKVVKVT